MLILGSFLPVYALSNKDLEKKVAQVQQKMGLQDWHFTVRFVTYEEMVGQNKCKCFGESLIFQKTKMATIIILDDAGYKVLDWKDMSSIHANELFAVLHEVLHVAIELAHPEFDDDMEELAVQQLARVVEHQPELK